MLCSTNVDLISHSEDGVSVLSFFLKVFLIPIGGNLELNIYRELFTGSFIKVELEK